MQRPIGSLESRICSLWALMSICVDSTRVFADLSGVTANISKGKQLGSLKPWPFLKDGHQEIYSLEWPGWWDYPRATGYRPLFVLSAKCISYRGRLRPLSKQTHESYLLLENSDCVCLPWNLFLLAHLLSHGIVTLVVTMTRLCCSPPELSFSNVKLMTYPATETQTLLR